MSSEGEFIIEATHAAEMQIDLDNIQLEEMTQEEIVSLKKHLMKWYDLLEDEEPDDSDCEQCERWEEQLNEIEDILSYIESFLEA